MALDGAELKVTISASTRQFIQAMEEARASARSSAEAMGASFKAASAASSADQQLIEVNNRRNAALFDEQAAASTNMGYSVREARGATRLLADELGLHLNRELQGVAARSSVIGPVMATAFSAFAVVGFIEIAEQAVGAVVKLYDRFVSLKDEEDAVNAATAKLAESTYQYTQQALQAREATIGMLAGPVAEAKQKLIDLSTTVYPLRLDTKEIQGLPDDISKIVQVLKTAEGGLAIPAEQIGASIDKVKAKLKEQEQAEAQLRAERSMSARDTSVVLDTPDTVEINVKDAEIKERALKALLTNLLSMQQEYTQKRQSLQSALSNAEIEANDKELRQSLANTDEKYTAQERASLASIALREKEVGAKVAADQISVGAAAAERESLASQRTAIEKTADERQRAAERTRKAQEASNRLAEQQLRDQSELASYSDRMARADLDSITKKIKAEEDLAIATIRGVESVSEAQASADEKQAARDLRDKKITPNQEGALLGADETKRHTGKLAELDQLKSVEQDPAKLKELDAQMEVEEIRHQARMKEIADDAAGKANEAQMKSYDRLVSASEESANRQLEVAVQADQAKLKRHEASVQEEVSAESSALNQWYAQQATILNAALAFAERTYGKDDEHYTALIRKKEQLDQQYAAKSQQIALRQGAQWDQLTRKMSATFESTINKLVMGEEGWAQVSKELYGQVASAFVTNSVKMVEQEVVAAVTHKSLLKTEILGDAKAAAAGAYKAMAGIPIVGPELGAAAAAATFAAVVALGSFETGGLALQTGPYILHEGEGVMTKRQTAAIERAGEVTNNSGARNFHQEVTLNHNGSNLSDAGFAKIMHRVMRKGLFSLR